MQYNRPTHQTFCFYGQNCIQMMADAEMPLAQITNSTKTEGLKNSSYYVVHAISGEIGIETVVQ